MRPKRYPFSGKTKASSSEIVKAWENAYSDFIAKTQKSKKALSRGYRMLQNC